MRKPEEVNMKKILSVLLLAFMLCSCGVQPAQPSANAPEKIISLSPNITEIVYFVGAGDRLIGRTSQCNYPPEVAKVESLGNPYALKIERVVELLPDVVLVNRLVPLDVINKIKSSGIRVETFDPQTVNDVLDTIDKVADICGLPAKSQELRPEIESLHKETAKGSKKLVYLEIWDNPPTTFGKNSLGADMVRWVGAENAGDRLEGDFPTLSEEAIAGLDPEVIIVPESYKKTVAEIEKRQGVAKTRAAKNGSIYIMNDDLLMRPSPRVLDALKIISQIVGK